MSDICVCGHAWTCHDHHRQWCTHIGCSCRGYAENKNLAPSFNKMWSEIQGAHSRIDGQGTSLNNALARIQQLEMRMACLEKPKDTNVVIDTKSETRCCAHCCMNFELPFEVWGKSGRYKQPVYHCPCCGKPTSTGRITN